MSLFSPSIGTFGTTGNFSSSLTGNLGSTFQNLSVSGNTLGSGIPQTFVPGNPSSPSIPNFSGNVQGGLPTFVPGNPSSPSMFNFLGTSQPGLSSSANPFLASTPQVSGTAFPSPGGISGGFSTQPGFGSNFGPGFGVGVGAGVGAGGGTNPGASVGNAGANLGNSNVPSAPAGGFQHGSGLNFGWANNNPTPSATTLVQLSTIFTRPDSVTDPKGLARLHDSIIAPIPNCQFKRPVGGTWSNLDSLQCHQHNEQSLLLLIGHLQRFDLGHTFHLVFPSDPSLQVVNL